MEKSPRISIDRVEILDTSPRRVFDRHRSRDQLAGPVLLVACGNARHRG